MSLAGVLAVAPLRLCFKLDPSPVQDKELILQGHGEALWAVWCLLRRKQGWIERHGCQVLPSADLGCRIWMWMWKKNIGRFLLFHSEDLLGLLPYLR